MLPLTNLILMLAVFWLLLSFHFTPLMLCLGVASVLLVCWLARRLNLMHHHGQPLHLLGNLVPFWGRLLVKIVQSNVDVVLKILGVRAIDPGFVTLKMPFDNHFSAVIYANAITLTPGTVSLEVTDEQLTVHLLDRQQAPDLVAMAKIIPKGEAH